MTKTIRVGKVSSVDYSAGTVRVVYNDRDGSVTKPLPMLSFAYCMPQVNDQVLVAHLSNGTAEGVVIGKYWTDKNAPTTSGENVYYQSFDSAGTATLTYADGTLTITAEDLVINGDVTINGNLHVSGNITSTE